MGVYVITGGTTGIGAATRLTLLNQGHEVFNIDYRGGDFCADLSQKEGRLQALAQIYHRYPEGIDGILCNAGVGPTVPPSLIFSLNFFAGVEMAEGVRALLRKKGGCCVATSSNSITQEDLPMDLVDMLTDVMDEAKATEVAKDIPQEYAPACYRASKHALARWVRRISPSWAADGLRINVVAPGNTSTPMTQNMTEKQKEAALLIPIPTRYGRNEFLDAQEIANGIVFLSSPLASGINGVVLYIDGGIDALLRSERF